MNPYETVATTSQPSFGRVGGRCDLIPKIPGLPAFWQWGLGRPHYTGEGEGDFTLHHLGLGAQFFGQTPVQVAISQLQGKWVAHCDVGGPCPSCEQRLTSPLKASPSVCGGGLQWEMLPRGVQPGSGPTGRGAQFAVLLFVHFPLRPEKAVTSTSGLSAVT